MVSRAFLRLRSGVLFSTLLLGFVCLAGAQETQPDPPPGVPPGEIDPAGVAEESRDPLEAENEDARPDATDVGFQEITPSSRRAVNRGLEYLRDQQRADGWIGTNSDYRIAVTALAGLAFLASGSDMTTGAYAENIRRAVEFFLDLRREDAADRWHIAISREKSRLHGHGYATLFLAECYGTSSGWPRSEELGEAVRQAVRLIVDSQEAKQGGWGYVPNDAMHEGSITVTQLQALRSARDSGISVPRWSVEKALDYLEKSKVERPEWAYFVYRLGSATSPSFPLAAAAVSSLNAVGKYRTDTVDKGLAFLRRYVPGTSTSTMARDQRFEQFWYYGQLYAAQAMFQSGGSDWALWFPAIREELVKEQASSGSWGGSGRGRHRSESIYGEAYPTAIACIILQIPYRMLPILQR